MINISSVFGEQLEAALRNHLPKEAVKLLRLQAEQIQQLENAMNAQQQMIMKLMKFAVLSKEYEAALQTQADEFDKKFGGMTLTERVREEDDDN